MVDTILDIYHATIGRIGRRDDSSLWRCRDRPGNRPMGVSDAVSVIGPVVE